MINLEQLYRQVIMDNYKNPKNKGLIDNPEYTTVHLKNPSCGDDMHVCCQIEDGFMKDIRHDGHGCSICCSSASVMSNLLKGKKVFEAKEIINDFYEMVKGEEISDEERMDEAIVYRSVSQFPARIKCATLAWKAIEEAINKTEEK
jgi:nitrogen fixation NifU-like protein